MGPASTKMGGMCMGMPDVCLTPAPPGPPVPIPYPNMAQCAAANPGTCAKKVMIMNQPVLTQTTIIPMSQGDEAGVAGGVMSGMNMGQVSYVLGEPTVLVEGSPIVTVLSMTGHNGASANFPAGMQVAPSQTTVIVG